MKVTFLIPLLGLGSILTLTAEEKKKPTQAEKAQAIEKHQNGADELALEQDDLSADVQELIDEQTDPKVIFLLSQVEQMMAEAVDRLDELDTGGDTIAIQTEIVEKIYAAAQQKAQGKEGQNMDAMLEMMKQMMGKGDQPGQKPGLEGNSPGQGGKGDSDATNGDNAGKISGVKSERRVPKAAGQSGAALPQEFQKTLDAYNKREKK